MIYATIKGDVTICSAYSHELPKYGMKAGLTNYAATYATGLLCARRLLTKYDLAETYEGNTENLGDDYNVEAEDGERRPFKCYLDTGLVRTSTGSRVFAALKGAVDGGLDIPHNDKRYAGYDLQDKSLDPETLERYIKGGVVAEYVEEMQEEVRSPDSSRSRPAPARCRFCFVGEGFSRSSAPANEPALTSRPLPSELSQEPEKYEAHFSKYHAEDFDPRSSRTPWRVCSTPSARTPRTRRRSARSPPTPSPKPKKLTYDERKANLKAKLEAIVADA